MGQSRILLVAMVWMARLRGAVAGAVEAVARGVCAAGWYRAGTGEGGERGIVAAAAGVGERRDGLGGGDGPPHHPCRRRRSGDTAPGRQELISCQTRWRCRQCRRGGERGAPLAD
jgi:hypothetical protein